MPRLLMVVVAFSSTLIRYTDAQPSTSNGAGYCFAYRRPWNSHDAEQCNGHAPDMVAISCAMEWVNCAPWSAPGPARCILRETAQVRDIYEVNTSHGDAALVRLVNSEDSLALRVSEICTAKYFVGRHAGNLRKSVETTREIFQVSLRSKRQDSVSPGGIFFGLVGLGIGAMLLLAGYRFLKFMLFMAGFLIGMFMAAVVGAISAGDDGDGIAAAMVAGIVVGLICGFIALCAFYSAIACIGCNCGVLIAVLLYIAAIAMGDGAEPTVLSNPTLLAAVIVLCGAFGGFVALKLVKFMVIVTSAATGAILVVNFFGELGGCPFVSAVSRHADCTGTQRGTTFGIFFALMFVVGVAVQYTLTGKGDQHSTVLYQQNISPRVEHPVATANQVKQPLLLDQDAPQAQVVQLKHSELVQLRQFVQLGQPRQQLPHMHIQDAEGTRAVYNFYMVPFPAQPGGAHSNAGQCTPVVTGYVPPVLSSVPLREDGGATHSCAEPSLANISVGK